MKNKYPNWLYGLLLITAILGVIYALPNLYIEVPAVQISPAGRGIQIDSSVEARVATVLDKGGVAYQSITHVDDDLLVRLSSTDTQLETSDLLKAELGQDYVVALRLASSVPSWMKKIGAQPMKQGLDLRGGVHFLLDVDIDSLLTRRMQTLTKNMAKELREDRIRYSSFSALPSYGASFRFRDAVSRDAAMVLLKKHFPELDFTKRVVNNKYLLESHLSPFELSHIRQYTIEQTMGILRNRINELGVSEAVVQQQGAERIAVDLPGIQDAVRAKQILGGTATLEFRLVAEDQGTNAKRYMYNGKPVWLERQVILSGDSITNAMSTYDQEKGSPSVSIQLGGGDSLFNRTTRANIGRLMAIVFVETKGESKLVDGKIVRTSKKSERLISVATIQSALGHNFQITGLQDPEESRNLALLLRAGALPAAVYPVEERMVGPTLGKENIERGLISLTVGMGLVLIIMLAYYRMFGLFANIALVLNLVFLIAILSIIGATLTLPGIAGIVLTVGMAVDANVLIYERIREELRAGMKPPGAIFSGYERAFATIVDANVTTLIVGVILFAVGTGPIKGFAVTLSIGLLTSMFTAIMYTRALTNLVYGSRTVKRLSIGIKLNQSETS